jgi:drug/metabolite transporter (DMT)-like permease
LLARQRRLGKDARRRAAIGMAEQIASGQGRIRIGAPAAYLLLTVAMLSWSANVVIARALAGTVPPFGLSMMRWLIAFLVVLPFAARELVSKRAIILRRWRILLLLALLGLTICNSLSYLGLQTTSAVNAALINSAGPALTLGAAFALNRERASLAQLTGMLVSLAGVLIIILQGDPAALVQLSVNRGDVTILIAVIAWAVYTVLLRRAPGELSPVALLAVFFAIGAVTLVPLHLIERAQGAPLPMGAVAWLAYLYVGLFPAVIAFFGWNRGVATIGASRAALFAYLMPLFSALLAYIFLGEKMALFHLVGAACIFCGIAVAHRRG